MRKILYTIHKLSLRRNPQDQRHADTRVRVNMLLRLIASLHKPVIFHSGILWTGSENGKYNRPLHWEALIDIPGLRFSMGALHLAMARRVHRHVQQIPQSSDHLPERGAV